MRMPHVVFPALAALALAHALLGSAAIVAADAELAAVPARTWSNPLPFEYSEGQAAPRREIRDPCIIREGSLYWLVFTMWPFRGREEAHLAEPDSGSSPGLAPYSSPDLKAWKFENWLVKSSELPAVTVVRLRLAPAGGAALRLAPAPGGGPADGPPPPRYPGK